MWTEVTPTFSSFLPDVAIFGKVNSFCRVAQMLRFIPYLLGVINTRVSQYRAPE